MAQGSLLEDAKAEKQARTRGGGKEGCLTKNVLQRGIKELERGEKRDLNKQSIKEERTAFLEIACHFVMASNPRLANEISLMNQVI